MPNFASLAPSLSGGAAASRAKRVAELVGQARLDKPPEEFVPAGYLPAPHQPRFISAAEEAAKKLPATVKAESLKNALIKGGAKPVELEYAGIDQFMADRRGQRVPSAEVLAHIEREGPLGQLGRVDQRAAWESSVGKSQADSLPPDDLAPQLADIRRPFDDAAAYPNTVYESYTEQGKRGDHSGYREVLFADPRNPGRGGVRQSEAEVPLDGDTSPAGPPFTMQRAGEPVNAHNSDYWIRYHNNPNEIAVQNIQSDIGQRISKEGTNRGEEVRGINQRLAELYALEDRYLALPDDHPDKADGLNELSSTIRDVIDYGQDDLAIAPGPDGRVRFAAPQHEPASPISRDDKWKDFLARQIVLESAAQGKPITLPTAANANAVEGMPVQAAAAFYERDIPDRIRKILKEFDPQGGGSESKVVMASPEPLPPLMVAGKALARLTPDVVKSMRKAVRDPSLLKVGAHKDLSTPAMRSLRDTLQLKPEHWGYDVPVAMESVGGMLESQAKLGGLSDYEVEQARTIGQLYGILERAEPRQFGLSEQVPYPPPTARRRPGTHIEMTPVARRNILERGMPILSVPAAIAAGSAQDDEQGLLGGLRN